MRCRVAQRRENFFLAARLRLVARDGIAGGAIESVEREHVVATKTRDRSGHVHLPASPLADLARVVFGQVLGARPAHQP